MALKLRLLSVPLILLAACESATVSDPNASALFYGTVRDSAGVPVAGAELFGQAFRGAGCGTPRGVGETVSAADGTYRLEIQALATDFVGCAQLTLTSSTAAFPPETVTLADISFREGALTDSTELDFIVAPLP